MWKIFLFCGLIKFNFGFSIEESCVEDKIVELQVELPHNYYCENVNFTSNMESALVFPHQKYVVFKKGHILFNSDFLDRFPDCSEIYFDNVHLELEEGIHNTGHLVSSIFLNGCYIIGDYNFFSTLTNLKQFEAFHNNFTNNKIDSRFFGNNSNLKVVTLFQNNFIEIEENVFEGLLNVEMLTLSENLANLTMDLSAMNQLIYLDLSGNHLTNIPCSFLPKNLIEISFPVNAIRNPNFSGCKFLRTLKRLDLSDNGIDILDLELFSEMSNIEEIFLSNNNLSNIVDIPFMNLTKLTKVDLTGNLIDGTGLESIRNVLTL